MTDTKDVQALITILSCTSLEDFTNQPDYSDIESLYDVGELTITCERPIFDKVCIKELRCFFDFNIIESTLNQIKLILD